MSDEELYQARLRQFVIVDTEEARTNFFAGLRAGREQERERCAKIAESVFDGLHRGICDVGYCDGCDRGRLIAAAIRGG